jgi:hypothetical protein
MIVVKLMGGMGNQMFQYAFGKLIASKYNKELILDLSFLLNKNQEPGFVYRDYDLGIFKLDVKTVNHFDLDSSFIMLDEPDEHPYVPEFLDLYKYIPKDKNFYISGYFQKHEYVKHIREQLLEDFKLNYSLNDSSKKLLKDIQDSNSVCVNIRRTDYITNKNALEFHGVYGTEYFNKAVVELNKKTSNPKYFIFSDDMEWCEENLKFEHDYTFVSHDYKGLKFGQYLYLMSACKNFIIPNSSFAWWAAWLNDNEEKIVITPKKWFKDGAMRTEGLKPETWINLE